MPDKMTVGVICISGMDLDARVVANVDGWTN